MTPVKTLVNSAFALLQDFIHVFFSSWQCTDSYMIVCALCWEFKSD